MYMQKLKYIESSHHKVSLGVECFTFLVLNFVGTDYKFAFLLTESCFMQFYFRDFNGQIMIRKGIQFPNSIL